MKRLCILCGKPAHGDPWFCTTPKLGARGCMGKVWYCKHHGEIVWPGDMRCKKHMLAKHRRLKYVRDFLT